MARFVNVFVAAQLLLVVSPVALRPTEAAKSFTVDYDKDTFMKDGQPFR